MQKPRFPGAWAARPCHCQITPGFCPRWAWNLPSLSPYTSQAGSPHCPLPQFLCAPPVRCIAHMRLPCTGVLVFCSLCVFQLSHSSSDDSFTKVRAVNLGGWLVVEGWIKPSLFDGIPNGDMLDGTQVQLKSVALQKYVSAYSGGGSNVTVDRAATSSWETFKVNGQRKVVS